MRVLGGLVVCSLVVACASAPKVEHPDLAIDTPEQWGQGPQGAYIHDRWWDRFEDSTLTAFVNEAMAKHPSLESAAARVDAAAAQATIAGAGELPELTGSFLAQRQQQVFTGIPTPSGGPLKSRSDTFGLSLDISWELDIWGRIRSAHSAALAEVQLSMAEYEGVRLSLIARVVKAYFLLLESKKQLRLAEEGLQSVQEIFKAVERRYESGRRGAFDLSLVSGDLADAEAAVEQRKRALDASRRALEIMLGRYPKGKIESPNETVEVPAQAPVGLPAQIVSRRPDLVVAERRLAANYQRVDSAEAALYPRIALTGSTGTVSDDVNDLLDGDFSVWNLAGNLLQPIFNNGRLSAAVDLADAQAAAALSDYANTALNAFFEVELALSADSYLYQQYVAAQESELQSSRALEIAIERYRSGVGDILSVLEAHQRQIAAASRLASVERERLDMRVELHLALGGGFAFELQEKLAAQES